MRLGRIDDGDLRRCFLLQELSRYRDAGGSPANDEHVVLFTHGVLSDLEFPLPFSRSLGAVARFSPTLGLVDREDAVVLGENNRWLFARFEHRLGEAGQQKRLLL